MPITNFSQPLSGTVPPTRLTYRYWCVVLVAWLVLSGLAFGCGKLYVDRVHVERQEAALARASVGVQALEQVILRSVGVMDNIQSLVQIRENLLQTGNKEGAEAIAAHIRSITANEQFGVLQVSMIGADGWLTWSSISGSAPVWLGDRPHFLAHTNGDRGIYISKPVVGRVSKRWSMQFTRRMTNPDGSFRGVAVVSFDPLHLADTMASLGFGANSVSAIWSIPEGELVSRSKDADKLLGRPADPDLPALVAAKKAPSGVHVITSSVDGRRLFQAYRVVGQLPFVATVSLDAVHELNEEDMLSTWVFLAAAGFTLFVGAVIALFVMSAARRRSGMQLELVRKEAEVTERARNRIAELLSGLPAAVYGVNLTEDGAVQGFSITDTAQRLTGWSSDELESRDDWEGRARDLTEADWHAYHHKIISEGDASIEYSFVRPDGTVVWLRDQARVVKGTEASGAWVVGYVSDITRERAIQTQAFTTSKLATLGEMATGLAHELNQPIATMALAAENAANALEHRGAEAIQFALQRMERITGQAARARAIVDHLRIFGRQSNDETGPIALKSVVDGALTLVESALRSSSVKVDVEVPDNLPLVLAQVVLAEHVVVNLILNARDAMEANPPERLRHLAINARHDPLAETVVLTIQDTGPGVPASLLDRIFEPFFTTKEVGKGTGLGLSLCHGLMNSFNGSISVANATDGGAVFAAVFRCAGVSQDDADAPAPRAVVAA